VYGLELGRSVQRTGAGHIVAASRLQLVCFIIIIVVVVVVHHYLHYTDFS